MLAHHPLELRAPAKSVAHPGAREPVPPTPIRLCRSRPAAFTET
ncbi:hypothetical protein [Ramlibacter rhizophilus]|nr:hypothetical protein [Ramlibacter rhizophilus]